MSQKCHGHEHFTNVTHKENIKSVSQNSKLSSRRFT